MIEDMAWTWIDLEVKYKKHAYRREMNKTYLHWYASAVGTDAETLESIR